MRFVKMMIIAIALIGLQAHAKRVNVQAVTAQATADGQKTAGNAQNGQGVSQANYDSLKQSSSDNSSNSQKGQAVTQIMAAALGVKGMMDLSVCGSSSGMAASKCVSGAVYMGMSYMATQSAKSFNPVISTSNSNLCEYSSSSCSNTNPYLAAAGKTGVSYTEANKALKSKGFSVDPTSGVVTTPSGETVDPSSAASLEAALGKEGMQSLMQQVAGIEKEAKAKVDQIKPAELGYEGGGGGGSPGTIAGFDDGGAAAMAAGRMALAGGANARKPAQVSGLSKNFNGDPIGVAADSIFMMMSRRYQLKSNQRTFLGAEAQ